MRINWVHFSAGVVLLSQFGFAKVEPSLVFDGEEQLIAVKEVISDRKIQQRLEAILAAIGSYEEVQLKVVSGVVIFTGLVENQQQIKWIDQLAQRLEGVVAVQNQLRSKPREILDVSPAVEEIQGAKVAFMRHVPAMAFALSVLAISFLLFFVAAYTFRRTLVKKVSSPLLLNAAAKTLSFPILLLGLYLALKISGLTGLAFTVLGGTGVLGIILGLGLKSSFEDYAASIFLSMKKPFRASDWVRIGEFEGIVQKVTSRSTLIIDFSGNHILMPNSIVSNSIITNKSANPKMRCHFSLGLAYGDSIEAAQKTILDLLKVSQNIIPDPKPWVLVDSLGGSAVELKVYFWINVREVSAERVKGQLRLEVKNLLLSKGFRFPDGQREIVFTNELRIGGTDLPLPAKKKTVQARTSNDLDVIPEVLELNRQALESDLPDQGENVI